MACFNNSSNSKAEKVEEVETVAVDYDKHCRTKPKHQQPRQLKENFQHQILKSLSF